MALLKDLIVLGNARILGELSFQAQGVVATPAFGTNLSTSYTTTITLDRAFDNNSIVYLYIISNSSSNSTVSSGTRGTAALFGYIGNMTTSSGAYSLNLQYTTYGAYMMNINRSTSTTNKIAFNPTYLAMDNPKLAGVAICPSDKNKYFTWESIPEKYKIELS